MAETNLQRQAQVDGILATHAGQPGPLLPILHAIQDALGYIPSDQVGRIASVLNLSRAEVHGVISFYHYFRHDPPGRHVVHVCRAEACQAMHCELTVDHAQRSLGVEFGATTADGQFTLEPVYCLGNCAAAPSVMVDEKLYGRVTPERFDAIVNDWRKR
jgi:formate dehydrogenase subunit gamma